ncbi:MAG: DNA mismatch repair endonuclease MutL [Clostridiales bacterium]|nr:DNA mismatch repair endonuclease MutL [Clostridiales bacterium]
MGIINRLDLQMANLIAAGEVVDRPASACKELIENAIDAGATMITIEIKNGGVKLMRVADNGCGMSRDDLPVSLLRHATSKIKIPTDLDGIRTLGFRGEALAAISAISHIEILSKRRDDRMGTLLECEPGGEPTLCEVGARDGTTIIVEDMFANVPARRKFLKKDQIEANAITTIVERIALCYPEIAIKLIVDGQIRCSTAGDGVLKNTIYSVFGRDFASKLTEIHREADGFTVSGYIGTPDNIRVNRNYQTMFINRRFVKNRCMQSALEQAYTSYIPQDKFPTCVLMIDIDPRLVDVNVHPAKLEVKLANERSVFEVIYYAVRGVLESSLPRPQLEFDGEKASEAAYQKMKLLQSFVPINDKSNEPKVEKSPYLNLQKVSPDQMSIDDQISNVEAEFVDIDNNITSSSSATVNYANNTLPKIEAITPNLPHSDESDETSNIPIATDIVVPENTEQQMDKTDAELAAEHRRKLLEITYTNDTSCGQFPPAIAEIPTNGEPDQSQNYNDFNEGLPNFLGGNYDDEMQKTAPSDNELPQKTSPEYRIIGEAYLSYIFIEVGNKIMIIDKHAAHERIIFEDLKKNLNSSEVASQMLLVPVEVILTPIELASLEDYRSEVEALGFEFDQKNSNTIAVRAIPTGVELSAVADMIVTIAGRVSSGTGEAKISRDLIFEKALYQASCKAAIKIGRDENEGHIKWICDRLLSLDDIKYCPHGRPVAFEISKHSIEHQFKRC